LVGGPVWDYEMSLIRTATVVVVLLGAAAISRV